MNRIEPQMHARLCALALGEVDSTERAALEQELAQHPDLRAEYARIQATIGLVRDLGPQADELSPDARELLQRALPAPQGRPWWRGSGLGIAAGVLLLVGGVALVPQFLRTYATYQEVTPVASVVARKAMGSRPA